MLTEEQKETVRKSGVITCLMNRNITEDMLEYHGCTQEELQSAIEQEAIEMAKREGLPEEWQLEKWTVGPYIKFKFTWEVK